jgi:hypothetical protein
MLPSPPGRRQEDRLSASIILQQNLPTDVQYSCLHILFQESDQFRRIHNGNLDDATTSGDTTKNQDTAMAEVIDFLKHQERDIYWIPQWRKHEVSVHE